MRVLFFGSLGIWPEINREEEVELPDDSTEEAIQSSHERWLEKTFPVGGNYSVVKEEEEEAEEA